MKSAQVAVLTVLFTISGISNANAAMQRKQESLEQKQKTEQTQKADQALKGKVRLVEVSQKLGLPSGEVSKFFKEEIQSGKANMLAWGELLQGITATKRNATKADIQNADLNLEVVRSYIEIRRSKLADNFHIRETDLLEIQRTFTLEQKINFGKVLRRAAELSNNGKLITMDAAFEQALKETGYLAKYRTCKI